MSLRKPLRLALLGGLVSLLLTGCMISRGVEELYVLPKLPEEYQTLSEQIAAILAGGAEYAAPTAGTNLQSVQLVDLNGDGEEEAVAFFRSNSEEKPLKIYIFQATGESYQQMSIIEGSGTAIQSIRYVDMDGDGVREILVSWRVSAEVQALEVYSLQDLAAPLVSTAYTRCETADLDGDGLLELVVVRSDGSETGGSAADYYDWDAEGKSLQLRSTAKLSMTVAELQWMQNGALADGRAAVFLTGVVTGAEETARAVTDILTDQQGELTNIVLSSSTGVSTEIFRHLNLQPADIDGDGATDVPMPALLPGASDEEPYWKIYWRSYAADGSPAREIITYHNQADGWYLLIPEEWDGHFTVRQVNASATERAAVFYSVFGGLPDKELLTICALTGTDREVQASRGGRVILRRQTGSIYTLAVSDAYSEWKWYVDQDSLRERFSVISAQWSTGEN